MSLPQYPNDGANEYCYEAPSAFHWCRTEPVWRSLVEPLSRTECASRLIELTGPLGNMIDVRVEPWYTVRVPLWALCRSSLLMSEATRVGLVELVDVEHAATFVALLAKCARVCVESWAARAERAAYVDKYAGPTDTLESRLVYTRLEFAGAVLKQRSYYGYEDAHELAAAIVCDVYENTVDYSLYVEQILRNVAAFKPIREAVLARGCRPCTYTYDYDSHVLLAYDGKRARKHVVGLTDFAPTEWAFVADKRARKCALFVCNRDGSRLKVLMFNGIKTFLNREFYSALDVRAQLERDFVMLRVGTQETRFTFKDDSLVDSRRDGGPSCYLPGEILQQQNEVAQRMMVTDRNLWYRGHAPSSVVVASMRVAAAATFNGPVDLPDDDLRVERRQTYMATLDTRWFMYRSKYYTERYRERCRQHIETYGNHFVRMRACVPEAYGNTDTVHVYAQSCEDVLTNHQSTVRVDQLGLMLEHTCVLMSLLSGKGDAAPDTSKLSLRLRAVAPNVAADVIDADPPEAEPGWLRCFARKRNTVVVEDDACTYEFQYSTVSVIPFCNMLILSGDTFKLELTASGKLAFLCLNKHVLPFPTLCHVEQERYYYYPTMPGVGTLHVSHSLTGEREDTGRSLGPVGCDARLMFVDTNVCRSDPPVTVGVYMHNWRWAQHTPEDREYSLWDMAEDERLALVGLDDYHITITPSKAERGLDADECLRVYERVLDGITNKRHVPNVRWVADTELTVWCGNTIHAVSTRPDEG